MVRKTKKSSRKRTTKKLSKHKSGFNQEKLFIILLLAVLILGGLNLAKINGWLIPEQTQLKVYGDTVHLDSMSLEQKIAQMVVVIGDRKYIVPWRNMQVGGLHMYALPTEHILNNTIIDFQYGMQVPFFVTADVEGCLNPFSHFRNFTSASEIKGVGEAFEKGFIEGEYLKEIGINLNFAPVVDLNDTIWNCRSFQGEEKNISEMAQSYLLGLQTQGIMGTAKHYPGKTLVVKDPHKFIVGAEIENSDLVPYDYLIDKGDVKGIMVSHLITTGKVDSKGIPSVVSREAIQEIRDKGYEGLIISDEIHMLGLKKYYNSIDQMYIAVFKAGNDVVLNFDRDPNEIYRMITVIKEAVKRGEIDEDEIDKSVTRILQVKGFKVVN